MGSEGELRYAAFISYRHADLDRRWARWLHRALETYRVPAAARRGGNVSRRVGRVFRDEDELPASAELKADIESALLDSRYLIVVCSPRTPSSRWVNREVERFRELGRHDRILALLIEGEPKDSFPRALVEIRRGITTPDGMPGETVDEVEPLAADVRPRRGESPAHLRRMARLRIAACLLGLRYDDLRRRDQQRRNRVLASTAGVLALLLLIVGGLAAFAWVQRNHAIHQRALAETQRRDAQLRLADSLIAQSDALAGAQRGDAATARAGEAIATLAALGEPTFPADLAYWDAARATRSTLMSWPAPDFKLAPIGLLADGRSLITQDSAGRWVRSDCITGRRLGESPPVATGSPTPRDISPGGRFVLLGDDGETFLTDAADLRPLARLGRVIRSHAFSPNDRHLAAVSGRGLEWWDLSGVADLPPREPTDLPLIEPAVTLHGPSPDGDPPPFYFIAASNDGRYVAAHDQSDPPVLKLWTTAPAGLAASIEVDYVHPLALCFVSGKLLIIEDDSPGELTLRDMELNLINRIVGHQGELREAVPHPDGVRALTTAIDRTAKVWDLTGNRPLATFADASQMLYTGAFAGDGTLAVVINLNGTISSFAIDPPPGTRPVEIDDLLVRFGVEEVRGVIEHVAIDPSGRIGVAATEFEAVIFDVPTGVALRRVGPMEAIRGLALSPDGSQLAIRGDSRIDVLQVETGEPTGPTIELERSSPQVAFTADGSAVVISTEDQTLVEYGIGDAALRRRFGAPAPGNPPRFAVSARDGWMAMGDTHGRGVRLFAADGTETLLIGPDSALVDLCFSPDGTLVGCATESGDLFWWRTGEPSALPVRFDGGSYATSILFLRNRAVVGGFDDGRMIFCDVQTGRELRTIRDHRVAVLALAGDASGGAVLSCDHNGGTLIHDLAWAETHRAARSHLRATSEPDATALGWWYAANGQWEWAARLLQAAASDGAEMEATELGEILLRSGDRAGALKAFSSVPEPADAPTALRLRLLRAATAR